MASRILPLLILLTVAWPTSARAAETVPGHYYGHVTLDFELDRTGQEVYSGRVLLDGMLRLRLERREAGWVLTVQRERLRVGLASRLDSKRLALAWGAPLEVPLREWNGRLLGGRYDLLDPSREPPHITAWERACLRHRYELAGSTRILPNILRALEDDEELMRRFVQRLPGPLLAARLVEVLGEEDERARRLAAHWVFDASRQRGYLDRVLRLLEERQPSETTRELIRQATPQRRPLVIAHRGNPVDYPENTLAAIRSAVELGADALEVDLCLTRDEQIVVWHDRSPGDLVTVARNLGLEAGMGYQPVLPGLLSSARAPTHELTLAELREHFGYARRRFSLGTFTALPQFEIPTFETLAAYVEATPQLKVVFLDVKLPSEDARLQRRFASLLRSILRRHSLGDRMVLMNEDAGTTLELKRVLGDEFAITCDVVLPSDRESAVELALELGNRVASVGRPVLGATYASYLDFLRRDRERIEGEGLNMQLIAWTLNDPLELREVIAAGVDGIVTDRPARLVEILANYRFEP